MLVFAGWDGPFQKSGQGKVVAFEPRVLIPGLHRELHQVCRCRRWVEGELCSIMLRGWECVCVTSGGAGCPMLEMTQVNRHLLRPVGWWGLPKKWSKLCSSSLQGSSFLMSWWVVLGEEWETFHHKLLAQCFCKAAGLCCTSTALHQPPSAHPLLLHAASVEQAKLKLSPWK